ncbi:MAG: hypothetical protein IKJ11_07515 [Clostridia bacterium]|nr:hypothetical protein [Clostridia bacterium]
MKKALLVALCFVIVSFMLVEGTFALPDLDTVFQEITALLQNGMPEQGGAGTQVHVELVCDDKPQSLFPGGSVSRSIHVQNSGKGDVYFRLVYAVQYDAQSWPKLDIRFAAGDAFAEHAWKDITIGSLPYKMKVFTYTKALPAGAASPEVDISIAMDASMTSEQIARYRSDFLQTQVLAIDPAPFTEKGYATAEAALDMALPLNTLSPF